MKKEYEQKFRKPLFGLGLTLLLFAVGILPAIGPVLSVSAEPMTFRNAHNGNWYVGSPGEQYIWLTDPSSGDHTYPQSGDTVNLVGNIDTITVDLNGDAECSYLNISPGTSSTHILALGSYNLSVDGSTSWSGGLFGGGGTFNNTATMTLSGSGVKTYWGTLRNSNRLNHTGGTLGIWAGSRVDNQSGAIYDLQGDGNIDFGGGGGAWPVFYNRSGATFRKSAGGGVSTIASTSFFNEGGTVDVQSGTLQLSYGGGTSTGGTFLVSSGATLDLSPVTGGAHVFSGSYTGSGGGQVKLAGGTINLTTPGATFSFPGAMFQWAGGQIQGILTNTGVINLVEATTKTPIQTLRNNNRINHLAGTLGIYAGSSVDNQAGAVYDMQGDGSIDFGGGGGGWPIFYNRSGATFQKSAGTGTSTIANASFYNEGGTVAVQSGTLHLSYGGGQSTGGIFNVAAGAALDLTPILGGNHVFTGTYTGSGGGQVKLSGGGISAGPTGFTLDFPGNTFRWGGGTLQGNVTNSGVLNLVESTNKTTITSLRNDNLINHIGGTLGIHAGSNVENRSGAVYDLQGDWTINWGGGGGGAPSFYIRDGAVLRKSSGTGAATLTGASLSNEGALEVLSGTLNISGSVMQMSGSTLTGGSWRAGPGALLNITTGQNIATNQGTIILDGAGAAFNKISALAGNQGDFRVLNGAIFNTAASLSNSGSMTVGPGSAVSGAAGFIQTQAGVLNIQIAGPPQSGQYGRVNVSGAATFNGTLNIDLTNGFVPSLGQTFQIMGFANSSGEFAAMNGLVIGNGLVFQVISGQNSLALRVGRAKGFIADYDGDGSADIAGFHHPTDQFFTDYAGNLGQYGWGGADCYPLVWDYDGDGTTEVSIYHIPTNQWFVRGYPGDNMGQFGWGQEDCIPVPGDYDGDGTMERAFYHTPSNTFFFEVQGGPPTQVQFGWNGAECLPVPGDYDGDGRTDLVIYHLPTNQWLMHGVGNLGQYGWNGAECLPVPADWDGNGSTDIAVYHVPTNQWFVRGYPGDNMGQYGWGGMESFPIPGDYDGDGAVERGFYRHAQNWWFIEGRSDFVWGWGGQEFMPITSQMAIYNWFRFVLGRFQ